MRNTASKFAFIIGILSILNVLFSSSANIMQQIYVQELYIGALLWFVIGAILIDKTPTKTTTDKVVL